MSSGECRLEPIWGISAKDDLENVNPGNFILKNKVFMPHVLMVALLAGWFVSGCTPREAIPTNLADAQSRVEGGLHVKTPEGSGPFPTVLYFHGASDSSWHPQQERILDGFVAEGFAVIFVDMYHGRGVTGQAVRSGALLPRATAGDVIVAVDWASRQSWVAPGKLGLFGISFGAATIMDALVLDAPGRLSTSLTEKPDDGLKVVKGAALLSPWCASDVMGFNLIKSVHEDFARQVPMLAILPQADTDSDPALCKAILERNKAKNALIEVIPVAGAGHTFAQEKDDYENMFADYDAGKAKDAWRRIYAFFKKRLG